MDNMTTKQRIAHRLLRTSLIAALGLAAAACGGGDDNETPKPGATGGTKDSSVETADSSTGPAPGATCEEKVYSELSDGCVTCLCGADPMLAPSCQGPCWDFLACAFVAQMGKCATFAAGGEAMRMQLNDCIGAECAAELAVPGSMVASPYQPLIGMCARSMGGTPAACSGDIGKFIAARSK
jgi:hypothetical protein